VLTTTMNRPTYLTNGQGGSGTSSSHAKNPSPCATLTLSNAPALVDERTVKELYEFGDKLGSGNFGVVWRVKHLASGQRYACKIINKEKVSRALISWPATMRGSGIVTVRVVRLSVCMFVSHTRISPKLKNYSVMVTRAILD